VSRNLTEGLALGAGLGSASTGDGWSTFIGSVRTSATLLGVATQFTAERDLLAGNAQTIRNHVLQTNLELDASRPIVKNLSTGLQVHHRLFSDGNTSNEVRFSPSYGIDIRRTRLSLGYSFKYIDYAKPTALGYYAPRGLLSNQGSVNWNFQWRKVYGSGEFDFGRFIHADNPDQPSEFAGSSTVAVGRSMSNGGLIEAYWTAGRDALGTPAGWRSMNAGFRLNWAF
jgi:hypothetical protein